MQTSHFIGTRGDTSSPVSFSQAILNPNAAFGGLFAPQSLPKLSQKEIQALASLSYKELAHKIFSYLNLDIQANLLDSALSLYDFFDDKQNPAPLYQAKPNLWIQKLYCGPTRAFKDMALQPFGKIFSGLLEHSSKDYLILVATSGDTGPATLESFANKEHIRVLCLYPQGKTSDVQRLQMTTKQAKNIKVLGIKGDFDDAQNALKNLLKDSDFKEKLQAKNIALSAANSVNFGRIAFQILYHIDAALKLYQTTQKPIQIIIPSGNFGNALGAFYAKLMGFPIQKIWIASNCNNVLTQLINQGIYDISNKTLQATLSPAMDILKSSNVERMLFIYFGEKRTKTLMSELEESKKYCLNKEELTQIQSTFGATSCDDEECLKILKSFAQEGFIIDPHTACGIKAYEKISADTPCVLCSTAEWTKFAPTLAKALGLGNLSDKEALDTLSKTYKIPIPKQILSLFDKPEHCQIIAKEAIKSTILEWL